ncbi:hypothetical protein [Leclercia adecarboxylata]|uniref:hypothetical protein n=1 Tax=Leclercia adecarboxylata TaxID=83655 RepID=UPI00124CDCDC|nr:hypothetical protein [Leclercia adecarboxylata]QFH49015.1 hypothetical protein FR819_06965 [Leclercia adecarboxylata]
MSDFKKYLLAGVDAARTAAANKQEIYDIINEVDKQLIEIYDSKVHFGIWNLTRPIKPKNNNILGGALSTFSLEREEYQGLVISNYENKNPIPLAEWFMSENGYPCKIIMDGIESFCSDKDDLENEISSLLSHVRTGKAILKKLEEYNNAQAQD